MLAPSQQQKMRTEGLHQLFGDSARQAFPPMRIQRVQDTCAVVTTMKNSPMGCQSSQQHCVAGDVPMAPLGYVKHHATSSEELPFEYRTPKHGMVEMMFCMRRSECSFLYFHVSFTIGASDSSSGVMV
jgi:hypothetical protein